MIKKSTLFYTFLVVGFCCVGLSFDAAHIKSALGRIFNTTHAVAKKTRIGYLQIFSDIETNARHAAIMQNILSSDIQGLLVHIDSRGGSLATGEALKLFFEKLRIVKCPVVIVIENLGASAAYLAAIGGDRIIAHSMSSIGSIGVMSVLVKKKNVKQQGQEIADVEYIYIGTGKLKTGGCEYSPVNDEYIEFIKQKDAAFYDNFCDLVSKARNISVDARHEWAEAKIFTGKQALELHLIDGIGGITEALDVLRSLMKERFGQNAITHDFYIVDFGK